MSELLKCPFCGGEASKRLFYKGKYRVHCNVCDAHSGDVCDTEAEAIAAWNSRAERTCKQEERGWGTEGDHARVWLTCGHDCMVPTVQDLPNYCPNCGAKVVSA